MDRFQLENLGIDGNENFDPEMGMLNTPMNANRGKYVSPSETMDAIFTINAINATSGVQRVELFGAADSIANIAKDSRYSGSGGHTLSGIPYRPATTRQLMQLIGKLATVAEASEGDIIPKPLVIFDDNTGNLVYIDPGITGTSYMDLADWSGLFDSNANLAWNTAGVTVIVECPQRPYKALLEDLKDLCLYIRKVRVTFSNITGINYPLILSRPRSFGGDESNSLETISYRSPMNNLTDVVDVVSSFYIDKLTTIYTDLAPKGSADYSTTSFNFSVSAFKNNGVEL